MSKGNGKPLSPPDPDDLEELRLVARLQSGDQEAFEPIYRRHLVRLHSYARTALEDPCEAEDAVHATFVTMLEEIGDYEVGEVPFRVWLFRVLRHKVLERLAQRRRTIPEPPELVAERIEASQNGIEEEIFERLAAEDFFAQVEHLPEAQRRVLVLRFLLGLGSGEIAEVLGSSATAVSSLQYRGLTTLRAELSVDGSEPPPPGPPLEMRKRERPSPVVLARLCALG